MNNGVNAILGYRESVLRGLEDYITRQSLQVSDLPWHQDVAKRLLTFATAGKLLRGSLVCYGYSLWNGGDIPAQVLDTAVALELAHASLLIHDDVIDRDDLRRGQPAIHSQYVQSFGASANAGNALHMGESLAVCAGDMALLWAFVLLGPIQGSTPGMSLAGLVASELGTVCAGQMEDIRLSTVAGPPTKREIYAVMRNKSAGYSLALPLMAGACLAGQGYGICRQVYNLGLAAGLLFQIRDDELGALGSTAKIGKPVGSDIREGKKTLLYYYLWQTAGSRERQHLQNIFGNQNASPSDIAEVQRSMRQHGVPALLQADIDRLERRASRLISRLDIPEASKAELRRLVKFCTDRQS